MSLPRYSEYRDSGVEWLGEIPSHWKAVRLSRLISAIKDGTHGTYQRVSVGLPLLSAKNVQVGRIETGDVESLISEADHADIVANGFPAKGDVLLTIVGTIGRSCVYESDRSVAFQRSVCFLRLTEKCLPTFLHYFIQSKFFQEQLLGRSKSSAQAGVYMGDVSATTVLYPEAHAEQIVIAEFLDRQTAQIDALIAEQENLQGLLVEKRQAIISHAVTRGSDPNAPMKDSGIPWLGEVPVHWEVRALKTIVSTPITDGPHETPEFQDEGVPFVSAEAVSAGFIDFDKIRSHISLADDARYSQKYKPQLHDIYMVKSGATTGVTAMVEDRTDFNIWSPLAAIRCDLQKADPFFVMHYLRSKHFQEAIALNWSFGTQQNIGMGVLGDLAIPLPPLDEQHEISRRLHEQIGHFPALQKSASRAIDLLKERRGVMVSAAVTGKIDVRGSTEAQIA